MGGVGIEGMNQGRTFENQADPGVAMTVNPPLVTLGQPKPPLQIEIIRVDSRKVAVLCRSR